jgi:hypothetical protein
LPAPKSPRPIFRLLRSPCGTVLHFSIASPVRGCACLCPITFCFCLSVSQGDPGPSASKHPRPSRVPGALRDLRCMSSFRPDCGMGNFRPYTAKMFEALRGLAEFEDSPDDVPVPTADSKICPACFRRIHRVIEKEVFLSLRSVHDQMCCSFLFRSTIFSLAVLLR